MQEGDLYSEDKYVTSQIYNLGSGHGYSVLEMAAAMERASGKKVRIR